MMDFVAVDFETAQKRRASPIQIGVVRVIDGVVGKVFSEYVTPPEGYRDFDPELRSIHGIAPGDIIGAPEWDEILRRLIAFAGGLPLVAHNASFERSVIRQTSAALGLPDPGFEYLCTLKLAREVDAASPNHRLNTLAGRYGIVQHHHHDARDDARVGAELFLHLSTRSSPQQLQRALLS